MPSRLVCRVALSAALVTAFASVTPAQQPPPKRAKIVKPGADSAKKKKRPEPAADDTTAKKFKLPKFFQTEEPTAFTLTLNVKQIQHDKSQTAPWRAASITFAGDSGKQRTMPIEVHTRGIYRLKTCDFPPLRLKFFSKETKGTIFHGLDKPKLINHCRDNDDYEQYILQEAQLYRVYNLITPASHHVRLAKITYVDSATAKPIATRWAYLQEEPNSVAARLGGKILNQQGAGPGDLDPTADALVGVFEYFIGNTDFAISALHNAELVTTPTKVVPVVFDFDFAGAVNTKYATPDPRLNIHSVRDRIMRGYCEPDEEFQKAVALFKDAKEPIYALYKDSIGKLMRPSKVEEALAYYDDFYATINDNRRMRNAIIDECLGRKK